MVLNFRRTTSLCTRHSSYWYILFLAKTGRFVKRWSLNVADFKCTECVSCKFDNRSWPYGFPNVYWPCSQGLQVSIMAADALSKYSYQTICHHFDSMSCYSHWVSERYRDRGPVGFFVTAGLYLYNYNFSAMHSGRDGGANIHNWNENIAILTKFSSL